MVPPLSQKVAYSYLLRSRFVSKSWPFLNFLANFTNWLIFDKMLALSNKKPTFLLVSGFFGCCLFTILFKYYLKGHFLRTTVPLVSYIRNSLRFWYYAPLSTCRQNLEKNWGHRENLGESGGQTSKGSDREKCIF